MPKLQKQFIVRKYILASSAAEAIKKDKNSPVDDVWIDEDWKKQQPLPPQSMGFRGEKV